MLICICCVIFITTLRVSFCINFLKKELKKKRIGSLVFSETWHGVGGPYIVVCDSQFFLKKLPLGKNGQKWPKDMVSGLFKKITSLVLSGFV